MRIGIYARMLVSLLWENKYAVPSGLNCDWLIHKVAVVGYDVIKRGCQFRIACIQVCCKTIVGRALKNMCAYPT